MPNVKLTYVVSTYAVASPDSLIKVKGQFLIIKKYYLGKYANKFSKSCTATHPREFDIVLSSPKMTIVTRKFEYLVNWTMRS